MEILGIMVVALAVHNILLEARLRNLKWVVKVMINDIYSDEDENY